MSQVATPMGEETEKVDQVDPVEVDGYENVFGLQTFKATETKSCTFYSIWIVANWLPKDGEIEVDDLSVQLALAFSGFTVKEEEEDSNDEDGEECPNPDDPPAPEGEAKEPQVAGPGRRKRKKIILTRRDTLLNKPYIFYLAMHSKSVSHTSSQVYCRLSWQLVSHGCSGEAPQCCKGTSSQNGAREVQADWPCSTRVHQVGVGEGYSSKNPNGTVLARGELV